MAPTSSFNIVGEGLVFSGVRNAENLGEALALFSRLLFRKPKNATFDALSQGIHADWSLHDDIVNPLGDKRQALVTVYTFDLDQDMLYFSDATQNLQIPLSCFRSDEIVLLEMMKPYEPPPPPSLKNGALPPPYWKPTQSASVRSVSFVKRVLSDFGHLWRHILRRGYSEHTFRQFAMAILRIGSLDVDIREEASRWLHTSMLSQRGPYVWIHSRPTWKACGEQIFPLGKIMVVLDQNLDKAHSLAEADASKLLITEPPNSMLYLLLSVRHVALYKVDCNGVTKCTEPAALLNGIDCPSNEAVLLLLHATAAASPPPPRTSVHKLPVELQDRVLSNVSEGQVKAAHLGCLLELGSTFGWLRSDDTRRGGQIEALLSPTHRHETTPVDSKIYFDGVFSGLAYR
ncbi:hypothetical protein BKA61DRAFT_135159 [Leptodontidium sp. MPI-SDFR-AT-0119]|nr:hypothetical protein BKA61DRAFT_135159 [Leptodontidium sp. MPI-SDFR-AT-0119]